jgi:hypothetical protein
MARQTVLASSTERAPRANYHMLGRPDEGRLFLVAALPHGDLVSRYRRRALFAFLGFMAAVYALGWLLQASSG